MNKQAFAFLTLFTLILMLSIYYVTLPADQGQLNPDQLFNRTERGSGFPGHDAAAAAGQT